MLLLPMCVRTTAEVRPPRELEIAEVSDAAGVRDVMALWIESFGIDGAEADSLCDERALRAWRMWVGYLDGRRGRRRGRWRWAIDPSGMKDGSC